MDGDTAVFYNRYNKKNQLRIDEDLEVDYTASEMNDIDYDPDVPEEVIQRIIDGSPYISEPNEGDRIGLVVGNDLIFATRKTSTKGSPLLEIRLYHLKDGRRVDNYQCFIKPELVAEILEKEPETRPFKKRLNELEMARYLHYYGFADGINDCILYDEGIIAGDEWSIYCDMGPFYNLGWRLIDDSNGSPVAIHECRGRGNNHIVVYSDGLRSLDMSEDFRLFLCRGKAHVVMDGSVYLLDSDTLSLVKIVDSQDISSSGTDMDRIHEITSDGDFTLITHIGPDGYTCLFDREHGFLRRYDSNESTPYLFGKYVLVRHLDRIDVTDPVSGICLKNVSLAERDVWTVTGINDRGVIGLCKFHDLDTEFEQHNVKMEIGRMSAPDYRLQKFEGADLELTKLNKISPGLAIRNVDIVTLNETGHKLKPVRMDYMGISKNRLKLKESLVPDISALGVRFIDINGRHLLTIYEGETDDGQHGMTLMRMMDIETGKAVRYNIHHSEGRMFTDPDIPMDPDSVRICGKYIVAECGKDSERTICSWNTETGKRCSMEDHTHPWKIVDSDNSTVTVIDATHELYQETVDRMRIYSADLTEYAERPFDVKIEQTETTEKTLNALVTTRNTDQYESGVGLLFPFNHRENPQCCDRTPVIIPLGDAEYTDRPDYPQPINGSRYVDNMTWAKQRCLIANLSYGILSDLTPVEFTVPIDLDISVEESVAEFIRTDTFVYWTDGQFLIMQPHRNSEQDIIEDYESIITSVGTGTMYRNVHYSWGDYLYEDPVHIGKSGSDYLAFMDDEDLVHCDMDGNCIHLPDGLTDCRPMFCDGHLSIVKAGSRLIITDKGGNWDEVDEFAESVELLDNKNGEYVFKIIWNGGYRTLSVSAELDDVSVSDEQRHETEHDMGDYSVIDCFGVFAAIKKGF